MFRAPARLHTPFFYGWVIVAITFVGSMITAGISGYGLSFFLIPMSEDLGISRTEFSSISLFRLASLPVIPLLGLLVDRKHGPRLVLTVGSIVAGLALIATSRVETLWQFYILFGVIFGIAMLSIGGQLVGPAVLAKWFIRKRGRVMAISAIGISGGGLIIAPLAGWLVGEFGWRSAWVVLGLVMIFAIAPAAGFLMRRQPEDVGLLPDGIDPHMRQNDSANGIEGHSDGWIDTEYPWTVRQAIRTRALWILVGVQTFGMMALMPVLFHQVAYVQDKDFSLQTAATIATVLAGFAIIGKLVYGYLVEHIHVRWVLGLALVPAGISLFLLVGAQSLPMLYGYAVIHGLMMGGFAPLMNVAWASYFGRQHMGAIRGVVTPLGNIVGAISPVMAGIMWSWLGSYDIPFTIFGLSWIVGGLLVFFATPPRPPEANQQSEPTRSATTSSAHLS